MFGRLLILILAFSFVGCSSTNLYMEKGTEEYKSLTEILDQNEWDLDGESVVGVVNTPGSGELLSSKFESATSDFNFDSHTATFVFVVQSEFIESKLDDWQKDYPDLTVDMYTIEIDAIWHISESGEILYIDDVNPRIILEGSGENFEGFYTWERSKFEMSKSASDVGGLAGLASGLIAREATGTSDFFVRVEGQYNIKATEDGYSFDKPLSKDHLIFKARK